MASPVLTALRFLAIPFACALSLAAAAQSGTIAFQNASEIPSTVQWGPASKGLRLSLGLDRTDTQVGDHILVTLYVENVGPDRNLFLGCNLSGWYSLLIVDSDGTRIPRKPASTSDCYSTPANSLLRHGTAIKYTFYLESAYRIDRPGLYTVTAVSYFTTFTSLLSNDVSLRLRTKFPFDKSADT
jgi:hypothetical protein